MQLRRLFFTWNNWEEYFKDKEEVNQYFQNLPHIRAFIIGFEIGEENKTPHLQGLLFFNNPKKFNLLRKYLKNNHIEKIIHLESAIDYVKKEEDFIEFGDIPINQGKRNDIEDFRDAILAGMTDLELLEHYPSAYFRFEKMIDKVRQLVLEEYYSKNNRYLKVIYIHGGAGVGKTSSIYKHFSPSQIHRVTNYKNPFDMYKGQKILVLDEFNSQFNINELLNFLDIYPLQLPARYADKWASYEYVFIISNKPLKSQYQEIDYHYSELRKALERRIHYQFYLEDSDTSRQQLSDLIENDLLLPF